MTATRTDRAAARSRGSSCRRPSSATTDRCLAACREALGLWRGEPFGELLGDEEPFRLEAIRLDELRIATMELSLEAELALGRQEFVIGELEAAVVEYPYRERLWYLLIEALHRDGRRVDAIRACGRLRQELAEVGISDSDELRELEARILGSDDVTSSPSEADRG